MQSHFIVYPVFALVALTLGVGLRLAQLRFAAVRRGDLHPAYYQLNRGAQTPGYLARVDRNYSNLLELPLLFYVAALLVYVSGRVDIFQLVLAWLFVGSRYVHSAIHTTYNNVRHRSIAFLIGFAVLVVLWLRLAQTFLH